MTTPKVLFVDQSAEMGGAEMSLLDIASARKDHSAVAVFAEGEFSRRLRATGVATSLIPVAESVQVSRESSLLSALSNAPRLIGLVWQLARQARGFDLIYANTQKAFVLAALAAPIARRPLVFHLRDMLTTEHFGKGLIKVAVGLANRVASCVVANSEATAQSFRDAGGRAPVEVVHNGIDPAGFDAVETGAAQADLRREIAVPEAPLVGVFSRLAEWKGQHVLVEALRELPDVHAVFVGGSLFEERDYEDALRARVAREGLADRVHFMGFRSDIAALMKGVDVIAHTSVSPEPFGRVVVEGMLAGKPVIGARDGGVLEIIEADRTGLLCKPGDPKELGAAIARLLSDPAFAREIAGAGERAARARFSLEACTANVENVVTRYARSATRG